MAQLPFLCFVVLNDSKMNPLIKATNFGKKNLSSPPAAPQELPFSTQALSVHCAWQAIDAMEQIRFGYIVDLGRNQLRTPFNQQKKCGRCYCQILSNVVK